MVNLCEINFIILCFRHNLVIIMWYKYKMNIKKYTYTLIFILISNFAVAAQNLPMSINWQTENISWNELQNIFTNNPSLNQLNIKFPNGVVWTANTNSLNNLYNKLGIIAKNLSFSSVEPYIMRSENSITLPINKLNNMSDGFFRQMQYKTLNIPDYLPNWVKNIIVMIYSGFMTLYDFASQEVRKFFY